MYKYIIGLMSGTSLDGLDLVYVKFDTNDLSKYNILHAETIPYNNIWRQKLQQAYELPAIALARLDAEYGKFLGHQVNTFIKKYKIQKVDLIASHGQTVFHQPENGFTTQIGNGPQINIETGIKTICDFRTQDVALGGQGAPLVPIGDRLLFGQYDYCLNIGGFANISYENNGRRLAYDICPTNIVLNHYAQLLGFDYDHEGQLSKQGNVHYKLLKQLNQLPYYKDERPKSLGWEYVEETILPILQASNLSVMDIMATYTEHIGQQIAKKTRSGTVLVTGGGALNTYMIERIQHYSTAQLIIPDRQTIDFKEALIFALLGLLKEQNQINTLASVTGSRMDHSSGVIYDYKSIKNKL